MKKITFILVATLCFSSIFAQESENNIGFRKGDKFASGSIGYMTTSNPDDSKSKNFNVSPRFGYFINDFIAVGAKAGYAIDKNENRFGDTVSDTKSFTIGVFGRYYLLPGNRFTFFGELGVGFGSIKYDLANETYNGVNASFIPGLSYFFSEHFALEASVGVLSYESVKQDNEMQGGSDSAKTFQVGLNVEDINLGLIFKF